MNITQEQLEELAELAEQAGNLIAASRLRVSPAIHIEGMRGGLESIEATLEAQQALESVARATDGTALHIYQPLICDYCKDEKREAFPYGIHDRAGKYWKHLCNTCFDALAIPAETEHCCSTCGGPMAWEQCWNGCDEGYHSLYDEDPLFYDEDDYEVCDICQGKGGYWVCMTPGNHKENNQND